MGWIRKPKTHNELVANSRDKKYVRGKRQVPNIPTSYWDMMRGVQRSWKKNTKAKCQFGGSRESIWLDDEYFNPELETYKIYEEEIQRSNNKITTEQK